MDKLDPGLYESLITGELEDALNQAPENLRRTERLLSSDVADRLALHLQKEIYQALSSLPDEGRREAGIAVARDLIATLNRHVPPDTDAAPTEAGEVLRAVHPQRPDGTPSELGQPLTPLLDTTLLTGASGEPSLMSELRSEIESADAIDVVMAFIRRSGINPLLEQLRSHCAAGKPLRVLTTTYTGSTERRALDLLAEIGADVRVSYDVSTTRLHAKAWVFHRSSGFSTGYVGSSNLTHSAQVTGLEWNVRAAEPRNPELLEKFQAVFDSYWESGNFLQYDPAQFDIEQERVGRSNSGPQVILSPVELRAEPFQLRLLELIELSRSQGHHRNLLVSATGTGKTVMAALDYASLRNQLERSRLLFIAHRKEILEQSLATFRYALRNPSFGELWVDGSRPERFEHVFASIQSLAAADLANLDPGHFDVVVVDEFHHGAAPSYQKVLAQLEPIELLGLTATPERSDGLPILPIFGDRIAAELRLWDAIEQQHLAPFQYYGIHDGLDFREVPWRRGRGYDITALSEAFTSSDAWARLVIQEVDRHVSTETMKCLGFCVDIEHAKFMARHFNASGIASVAVWGDSPTADRQAALADLASGKVKAVFSVDLFNEGVDVPDVDTILMLRPTESPTLFLQQLGRGLRKHAAKSHCSVLDFVGLHRREFRFDRRYRALLGGSRRSLERSVQGGFPFLPAGCHMQLDEKASEIVLRSLRDAIPSRWPQKVDELRSLRQTDVSVSLSSYLRETGLELEDVYTADRTWSDLQEAAGLPVLSAGSHERTLRRAVGRLLHIDDPERIDEYRHFLGSDAVPDLRALPLRKRRLAHMLGSSVADQALPSGGSATEALELIWSHNQVKSELLALLDCLQERIDHVHRPLETHPESPLQIHARYTRIEILTALGLAEGKVPSWQSGVYDATRAGADLLAFTLDKTSGGFSPTTRYRDYAISDRLIHWESQSATRAESETGLRYRNHERQGRSILLFARLTSDDRAFWFLGPGRYRGHSGERPMAVTWQLDVPLSGDMFSDFAAAVA